MEPSLLHYMAWMRCMWVTVHVESNTFTLHLEGSAASWLWDVSLRPPKRVLGEVIYSSGPDDSSCFCMQLVETSLLGEYIWLPCSCWVDFSTLKVTQARVISRAQKGLKLLSLPHQSSLDTGTTTLLTLLTWQCQDTPILSLMSSVLVTEMFHCSHLLSRMCTILNDALLPCSCLCGPCHPTPQSSVLAVWSIQATGGPSLSDHSHEDDAEKTGWQNEP